MIPPLRRHEQHSRTLFEQMKPQFDEQRHIIADILHVASIPYSKLPPEAKSSENRLHRRVATELAKPFLGEQTDFYGLQRAVKTDSVHFIRQQLLAGHAMDSEEVKSFSHAVRELKKLLKTFQEKGGVIEPMSEQGHRR